jgi:hypothetical protein
LVFLLTIIGNTIVCKIFTILKIFKIYEMQEMQFMEIYIVPYYVTAKSSENLKEFSAGNGDPLSFSFAVT